MAYRICFKLPPTNRKVCIEIPLLINPWWKRFPPEFDSKLSEILKQPHPEPWMQGIDIKPELARDVQVLASIHALSGSLSDVSRRSIQEAAASQMGALKLPTDVTIDISGKAS